jgi:hypothetical protein
MSGWIIYDEASDVPDYVWHFRFTPMPTPGTAASARWLYECEVTLKAYMTGDVSEDW